MSEDLKYFEQIYCVSMEFEDSRAKMAMEIIRLRAEVERMRERFGKCKTYLREGLILKPEDNWQWGYRAAILDMADSLLFDEPTAALQPPEEVRVDDTQNAG